jgi:hypothetical protein
MDEPFDMIGFCGMCNDFSTSVQERAMAADFSG